MLPARLPLLMLAILLPLGCGKVQSSINPSDATLFNQEWKSLVAQGEQNTHPAEPPGEAAQAFFSTLAELQANLENGPLNQLSKREPPDSRAALNNWLISLQPLFDDIAKLLGKGAVKAAIQSGQSLAQRPSQLLQLDPPDRFATPPLGLTLRLIRPLCAKAVYCAFSEKNSNECILYLSQALDLIQLLDDGSLRALQRSAVLGSEVLVALQKLLPRTSVTPDFLRSQIEPRLALMLLPGRLENTLQHEAIYRMAIGRNVILKPQAPSNAFGLKYLNCEKEQAMEHCLTFLAINKSVRTQYNVCSLVAQETARGSLPKDIRAIADYHDFEIAGHLARVALALNEHKWLSGNWPGFLNELEGYTGNTPSSPCRARRVEYKLDFNGMRLASFDRVSLRGVTTVPLHIWSWTKQDLSDLNATR